MLLTSCTSIRPIVKIGVIAPFEGLYRESGYAALEGVRQAVNECAPPGMDVMPLALDDSGDPTQAQRAAQKLLVDPAVQAVIGPFLLDAVPAVTQTMAESSGAPVWFVPILVDPATSFAIPTASTWLTAQIDYVAAASSATRVLLLGLPAAWDALTDTQVPTQRIDDLDTALATIVPGDALLWLGRPDQGAAWQNAIRQRHPSVDFWLAEQAGNDIFAAHIQDQRATHWLHWTQTDYNYWSQPTDSATERDIERGIEREPPNAIEPTDATRELAYHATCVALDALDDNTLENSGDATSARQPVNAAWELQGRAVRARHATIAR